MKYRVITVFYFPKPVKNKFTDKIKAILYEDNEDNSFKREVAYFLSEEDAQKVCDNFNCCEGKNDENI